jgi:ribonucleoside-diphosphate reductase beta chain
MLALTGQKFLLGILRELGILRGFYSGFTAVARDESRHVNFGVRALMEAGVRDPALLDRATEAVFKLLEPACWTVAAPERKYAISPEESPPNLRISPFTVREFSLHSLTKRLRVVGVSKDACEEITKRGTTYFEDAWGEYEKRHGEDHPFRFFERMEPAAS